MWQSTRLRHIAENRSMRISNTIPRTNCSSFSYPDDGDYFVEQPKEEVAPSLYGQAGESASLETASQHYQYKGHYILTSVKSGLMVIDQHRAHVRILYDRYLSQIASRQGASQGMLFPDIVQVSASEIPVLQSIMDDLSYLGFELTDLGGGSYAINGVPAGIEGLFLSIGKYLQFLVPLEAY